MDGLGRTKGFGSVLVGIGFALMIPAVVARNAWRKRYCIAGHSPEPDPSYDEAGATRCSRCGTTLTVPPSMAVDK